MDDRLGRCADPAAALRDVARRRDASRRRPRRGGRRVRAHRAARAHADGRCGQPRRAGAPRRDPRAESGGRRSGRSPVGGVGGDDRRRPRRDVDWGGFPRRGRHGPPRRHASEIPHRGRSADRIPRGASAGASEGEPRSGDIRRLRRDARAARRPNVGARGPGELPLPHPERRNGGVRRYGSRTGRQICLPLGRGALRRLHQRIARRALERYRPVQLGQQRRPVRRGGRVAGV